MVFGRAAGRVFRAAARVGRARRSATNVPDEWPSPPTGGTEPGLQTVWPIGDVTLHNPSR